MVKTSEIIGMKSRHSLKYFSSLKMAKYFIHIVKYKIL